MKDVIGYENIYQISTDGRVWAYRRKGSSTKGKWLKPGQHYKGYLTYTLTNAKGKRKFWFAHRLVANAYIANPRGCKELNHRNGKKTDNAVANLEWCTRLENMKHAFRQGMVPIHRGEAHGQAKLTEKEVLEIRVLYSGLGAKPKQRDTAALYGVNQALLWGIVHR